MVTDDLQWIRQKLLALEPAVAEVFTTRNSHEEIIEVVPRRPGACRFWIGMPASPRDTITYGLGFGHGLAFEDIDPAVIAPSEVIDAIVAGDVTEITYRLFGMKTKIVGMISLESGRIIEECRVILPLPHSASARLSYESYSKI